MDSIYTYLLINIATIAYPIAQSFERRLKFYNNWRFLFPAMAITGSYFIVWDILKTYYKVWEFNPKYLLGINIINLPIEEWLFFITVPFACVFLYEVLNYYVKKDILGNIAPSISLYLGLILVVLAFLNYDKAYTFVVFLLQGAFLLLHFFVLKRQWLGRFFLAYFVSLVPFMVVNGILTSLPVVIYDNTQNLGIRLYTIPIEDTIYSMMLIMMNITFYEQFRNKSKIKENKHN
ncbi:MAG: lycopene cyclase domain-containing protein [Candidatus Kapabacteria bacterium]|nr:lycopene cyclase domain-containing protein [Candidatus Kapabacteria bacterium]